jgi:hypothetical protein
MSPRLRALSALPVILLLLATGCGDDKKDPDAPDDATIAAAINLEAADLGPGWTATAPDPADAAEDVDFENSVMACLKQPAVDPPGDDIPSEDFADANEAEISSSVDLYSTPEVAKTEFELATSDKGVACVRSAFKTMLQKEIGSSGTVSDVTVVRRKQLEALAGSAGFHITVKAKAQGRSFTFGGDFVTFVRGRAGVTISTFSSGGLAVPEATLLKAARAVEARATANA